MKVLIITLYSGENEFNKCIDSVESQKCDFQFEQIFIKNKTKQDAHNELYSTIMERSNSYQYFVKLDSDMIFTSINSLQKIIDLALQSQADIFAIPVDDYMTGKMIWSLNVYRSGLKWQLGTQNIFTDQQNIIGGYKKIHKKLYKENSLVSHASDPSDFQAFLFGVHRASKIVQHNSDNYKIGHAYGQYKIIKDVLGVYKTSQNYKHALALIGASKMLLSKLNRSDVFKKEFYKKDFENISFEQDLNESIKFLQKPAHYIFFKAVGLRSLASGISSYIYNKYKLNK